LVDGVYRRELVVRGHTKATFDLTFTVTVCPADLIAGPLARYAWSPASGDGAGRSCRSIRHVTEEPVSAVMVMPPDTAWSVEDLEHLPDDGQRYELMDAKLLVSAAPNVQHQRAVGGLLSPPAQSMSARFRGLRRASRFPADTPNVAAA
jgi:hypothetical protein